MSQKSFSLTAGVVFLLIAVGHILRLVFGAPFTVEGISIPMWVSGVVVVLAGALAYEGIRLAAKSRPRA